jgi:hypothetical protein
MCQIAMSSRTVSTSRTKIKMIFVIPHIMIAYSTIIPTLVEQHLDQDDVTKTTSISYIRL